MSAGMLNPYDVGAAASTGRDVTADFERLEDVATRAGRSVAEVERAFGPRVAVGKSGRWISRNLATQWIAAGAKPSHFDEPATPAPTLAAGVPAKPRVDTGAVRGVEVAEASRATVDDVHRRALASAADQLGLDAASVAANAAGSGRRSRETRDATRASMIRHVAGDPAPSRASLPSSAPRAAPAIVEIGPGASGPPATRMPPAASPRSSAAPRDELETALDAAADQLGLDAAEVRRNRGEADSGNRNAGDRLRGARP